MFCDFIWSDPEPDPDPIRRFGSKRIRIQICNTGKEHSWALAPFFAPLSHWRKLKQV